jgi:hypothetical protein
MIAKSPVPFFSTCQVLAEALGALRRARINPMTMQYDRYTAGNLR